MAEFDFTLARLRELQLEAEAALEAAGKAFSRLQAAVAKIEGEIEHLDHLHTGGGGVKGQRAAFASPLQGMCYIAIWLAFDDMDEAGGVTTEQFIPYLTELRDKDGDPPDLDKIAAAIETGRGKQVVIAKGRHTLLAPGLEAVRLHWKRVSGIPEGRSPPPL